MKIPSALRAKIRRQLLLRCLKFLPWPLLFCAPAHREQGSLDAPFFLQSFWVAETRVHDAPRLWHSLRPGDRVELRAVATTDRSRVAVGVYRNRAQLGELPRLFNESVLRLLRGNATLEASITEISGFKDYPGIHVGIWLR